MKILIAGTWLYSMYEKALADALGEYGHTVIGYSWVKFFRSTLGKFENKYAIGGFYTNRMNKDLLSKVKNECPDIFLAWRATNIFPATLRKMRNYGVKYVASYNHDDFTGPSLGAPVPIHHFLHWRLYLKAAKYYDCHFVKRESNIKHLEQLGSSHNEIMPMWFVPLYHRPVALTPDERARFSCDAVFIGHYEPDDRVNHLAALVKAGLSVKLFGDRYWTTHVLGDLYSYFSPITPAVGDNYAKALCGAKVCLAFLSKLNRDTYTRRCFEIPACGRVLLAERTDDLLKMFVEDKEACFFSSTEELVEKAKWLVENSFIAQKIAEAGRNRVWADGHDVKSRTAEFLSLIMRSSYQ